MNLREGDVVSAVALVVEDSAETAAEVAQELPSVDAGETTAQPPELDPSPADGNAPEASQNGGEPAGE